MKNFINVIMAMLVLQLITGCNKNPSTVDYVREISVFGYLHCDSSMTEQRAIYISETRPIDKFYDPADAAISGATVKITDLDGGEVWALYEIAATPGRYNNAQFIARAGGRYRLDIDTDGENVYAETSVPAALTLTSTLRRDTVNVESYAGISRRNPVFLEGEDVDEIMLVDVFCNEEWQNAEYINPFMEDDKYPQSSEQYDGGGNAEPRHIQGMARLHELQSDDYPGQYVVDWFSSMIIFYGSYTIMIAAIDQNYHDYLISNNPERNGGIVGGIGVFGSMVGARYELEVVR
ncbi:DUF4249 family protein [bacterium]|nr:DUF4249 family protein [bacterium]